MLYSRSVFFGFAVVALGAVAMEVAPPVAESSDPNGVEKAMAISNRTSKGHSKVEISVESWKETRSITVMYGSITDFSGNDILVLGETAWLALDGSRTSLILALGDSTLVAYHSDRAEPTVATFVNVDPMSVMNRALAGAAGGFPCGPGETQCQCIATSEQTCSQVALLSTLCCPSGQFCTCKTFIENDCIVGIKASCIEEPTE